MLKNYFLITLRFLKKNLGYTAINILGLSAGMAATILILLWIIDEVSYDRFHQNTDEIYRVYEQKSYTGTDDRKVYYTPGLLAPELSDRIPNLKHVARLTPMNKKVIISFNEQDSYDYNGYFGDQEALDIFTFIFIYGSPKSALTDPNSIILTKEKALSIFGDMDPVGKSVLINSEQTYTVKGVIDLPKNTHLQFSFIIPFENRRKFGQSIVWSDNNCYTYVQIDRSKDYKQVEKQLANVVAENGQKNTTLYLEPLKRSYLYNIWGTGAIHNVRIFSIVAILVLLIACINFINLTTARSAKRAKEIGIRKVAGATKTKLIKQFIGESIVLTTFSLVLAAIMVMMFLPLFNFISGKSIALHTLSTEVILLIFLINFITGFISGLYPAFFLSSFNPVNVLKGKYSKGSKTLRTALVVFQFTLSAGLIVATLLVNRQLNFITNKNLGFSKNNIVVVSFNPGGREKYNILKEELVKITGIESVTMSGGLPNKIGSSTNGVSWVGKADDDNISFNIFNAYYDFPEVFQMDMVKGRAWNTELASDTMGMIINEEAAKVMSLTNPLEQDVELWGSKYHVIGVVKNFNFASLKEDIKPLIMYVSYPFQNNVCIRIKPQNISNTLKEIENVWNTIYPGQLFNFSFFDQEFENMYITELRMKRLFTVFSFLAILISSLGLVGLANYMAEQKFKEIAIRKTFGASVLSIGKIMIWEFIKWVLLANIIGWLVAFYFMKQWLKSFAFKVSIKPDLFIIAGLITILIALFTISFRSFQAARMNPVRALKYE